MRVPLSWLQEYVTFDLSNEKLSDLFTLSGIEVDKIESNSFSFKGVVVGQIKTTKPHPHSDRLKIATVFDGNQIIDIVCGDLSCISGMKVALATIGSVLTDKKGATFKIKKSKFRGIYSFGMLCTEEELGLKESAQQIMIFDKKTPVGVDVQTLLGDTIFEISLTPNLGHLMSIFGIARNLQAFLNQKIKPPSITFPSNQEKCPLTIQIDRQDDCYRYCCAKISGVKVRPSPQWMIDRLGKAGLKSINNIVDITNYVMLELGQPLHAFDANKVHGQTITMQSTTKEIVFHTLDGEKRNIPTNVLMVHDEKAPIAIAGIIGGANATIDNTTTAIILEGAHFNPSIIRYGSKVLGLRTESSSRFERGIDFQGLPIALNRAIDLMLTFAGGTLEGNKGDKIAKAHKKSTIFISQVRTNKILGTQLTLDEIDALLQRLDMETKQEKKRYWLLSPHIEMIFAMKSILLKK